ncbi:hypothetical protein ACG04R_02205 [Roseateles sp. BYS78W]|uniref:Uncharacterized protein n=1 Tax=Pelomonas candidula TaxID=3299025 RepID=A0ABW7H6D1_9BURK
MIRLDKPSGSLLLVGGACGAGSPARRRGNFGFAETFGFLLRGQKKVTKEEALNRTRPRRRDERRAKTSVGDHSTKRTAALSRLTCHAGQPSNLWPVRRAAARRAHQNSPMQRRSGGAADHHGSCRRPSDAAIPGEPGVQPALSGMKGRWMAIVIRTAARAQRVASSRNDGVRFRALPMAVPRWCAVQGLFFGDFLLAPQKKVTPPPGGTPGNRTRHQPEAVSA